ncbi:MAG: tetratricopeptide repeat protein, partial [Blastocatellia bacterium]|nr:tetratricopeptide repeat protein [Blastocatellia bacterium]
MNGLFGSLNSVRRRCRQAMLVVTLTVLTASLSSGQSAVSKAAQVRDHLQRAQAALQANQPEVAESELRAVLAIDPGNAEAHVNLGVLAFFHGDCQSASPHFENAIKTQPSLVKAEALLGICDKRLGRNSAKARLESSFSALKEPRLIT